MGWEDFVKDKRIEYVRGSGNNNLEVWCPFCRITNFEGHSKKFHMGLHLDSAMWACWRDKKHRSRGATNPERLIQKLLKCSIEEAEDLALIYFGSKPLEFRRIDDSKVISPVVPPTEFFDFNTDVDLEKPFIRYLNNRVDASFAIPRFNLKWCIAGENTNRVVVPIIYNGEWYSWVARSISAKNQLRYLAAGKTICNARPSDFLFDLDNLTGGKVLLITEGVFDVMAVAGCVLPNISATCLFGKVLTTRQLTMIAALSRHYQKVVFALDRDAWKEQAELLGSIGYYVDNYAVAQLKGKDFGSMSQDEIKEEISKYV